MFTKKEKKLIKKIMCKDNKPFEMKSLQEDWHRIARPNECDGRFEYGFFDDEPEMTIDELREAAYNHFGIQYHYREYDCTGQTFTQYISVHRNPCGYVSVIHRLAIDC